MNILTLNDYLDITNYGSKLFEYRIKFKNIKTFFKDIKDIEYAYWNFGDGVNETNIELANMVASFVKPYLPPYTKLVLKTIYLKYQRQERPTEDCLCSLLDAYINQFNFDKIQVPYLHGINLWKNYHNPKIWIYAPKQPTIKEENIILPDEGAKILLNEKQYFNHNSNVIICKKERKDGLISTKIEKFDFKNIKEIAIVDDIIAGGDSIINVINLVKLQYPDIKITIYCIFLMSKYGYDNIMKQCNNVIIKPIYKLY